MSGYTGPTCEGWSRQNDRRCQRKPIPFGTRCIKHGGNLPTNREKARQAMLDYELWSSDPHYIKRLRIEQWRRSNDRWEMRKAKKAGPEYVRGLERERAAAKAEKRRVAAETARVLAGERQAYKQSRSAPEPAPVAVAEFDPWTHDWMG